MQIFKGQPIYNDNHSMAVSSHYQKHEMKGHYNYIHHLRHAYVLDAKAEVKFY